MADSTLQLTEEPGTHTSSAFRLVETFASQLLSARAASWNWKAWCGLASLVIIWAAWTHGTWGTWGSLTADCGREMYVPTVLAQGKTLYRDVWYLYGPLAPYVNSVLFRMFGVHLSVLYWMGSLSALGSALFLYFAGMRLSSPLAGWTAGAVVLTQSFQHSLFSFPLPYSFASVYGCFTACLFLWLMIRASQSRSAWWVFGAGSAAAVALLLKLEIGAACYVSLVLLVAVRAIGRKSRTLFIRDILVCLPGVLVCGMVLRWMLSLGGVEFLTQENISSWPTSYFMKTYGKYWLERTGFSLNATAFAKAMLRTLILIGFLQALHLLFSWRRTSRRLVALRILLLLGSIICFAYFLVPTEIQYGLKMQIVQEMARYLFFPQDMVLYVGIAAIPAWLYFGRQSDWSVSPAIPLCFTFACLLAFRTLLITTPWGYPIYYDGPAVLSILLLAMVLLPKSDRPQRWKLTIQAAICVLTLTAALLNTTRQMENPYPRTTWLTTDRGSILLSADMARQYQTAIQFMKEQKLRGEEVLSVPEDTGLYFFSATDCPTRVYAFVPGVVVPGKMTEEVIQQIERKPVRYLIWSNRLFPEYNALRFGVEFDQPLGKYLFSHYHRVRPLQEKLAPIGEWNAYIWERNSETTPNDGVVPAAQH
jgi:hypothetical protein